MGERNKMICPDCGAEMNHHANKLDYSSALDEPEAMDALGGVVQEVHTCPECGQTMLRQAADDE
jgi:ribosomal protein S27AE